MFADLAKNTKKNTKHASHEQQEEEKRGRRSCIGGTTGSVVLLNVRVCGYVGVCGGGERGVWSSGCDDRLGGGLFMIVLNDVYRPILLPRPQARANTTQNIE